MGFEAGKPRPPGSGRHKGSRNKYSKSLADDILAVFHKMGGVKELKRWAGQNDSNKALFYTRILTRVLPLQVTGDPTAPISITFLQQDANL